MSLLLLLSLLPALASQPACQAAEATTSLQAGLSAMTERRYAEARDAFGACLSAEAGCTPCAWERGWALWAMADYKGAAEAWRGVIARAPDDAEAQRWLAEAERRATAHPELADGLRVPIGTTSTGEGPVTLTLVARFQNYTRSPKDAADHYDPDVRSPKSVRVLDDGSKVYVNSLEGRRTVVYDAATLTRLSTIQHSFDADDAPLFHGQSTVFGYAWLDRPPTGDVNRFAGQPVESASSHGGRYLWIPYYRRDWDRDANSPSALAVVDTRTDTIVRVFPTGPIPKYVTTSPDGALLAVIHWGDNTAGIIDIRGEDPAAWAYRPQRLVVERALDLRALSGQSRDDDCGLCLRGAVFTPDSRTLLIARMRGGVAGFDVETMAYLGTVTGERESPRHLVLSPDGQWLYASLNNSGHVGKVPLASVRAGLARAQGGRARLEDWQHLKVGYQARTLDISPDGRFLFVALQASAEVVVVDAARMQQVARVRTDAWAVGLALAPDGRTLWVTSQGDDRVGGNSVGVYRVQGLAGEDGQASAP